MLIKACGRTVHTGMGNWMESWARILVEWIYPAEGSLIYVHVVHIGDVIPKTNQSVTVVISHALKKENLQWKLKYSLGQLTFINKT